MKNILNLPTLLAFAALTFVSSAKADDTLLTLSGEQELGAGDVGNLVVGVAFTPTTDITLTQLGAYAGGDTAIGDSSSNGFVSGGVTTQDFTAVLYSFSETSSVIGVGTVIANAVISSGTAVNSDNVAFTTLGTPITLTAGTEYFIGADGGTPSDLHDGYIAQKGNSANDFAANVGFFNSPTDVTLDTSGYSSAGTDVPVAPTSVAVGTVQSFNLANVYFAGDLRYVVGDSVVPEPSALAYGVVGLAGLAFVLRRRHTRSL